MQPSAPLPDLTCHMGSHSVSCQPAEVTFPPLPQPKLVLDLVTLELTWWMVKHRSGLPVQRRSPIPALTGFDVEQLPLWDQRRYHYTKPSACSQLYVRVSDTFLSKPENLRKFELFQTCKFVNMIFTC